MSTKPLSASAGPYLAWESFSSEDRGTVVSCWASASVQSTSGAAVWVLGVDGDTLVSRSQVAIPAGASTLSEQIVGGGWGTTIKIVIESGACEITDLSRSIYILNDSADSATGATGARATIGDRVTVDAQWHYDAAGDYAGAGTLVERPDHVIEHYLRTYMGATAGQIDAASFDAAGALFAAAISGGYKVGWIIPKAEGWENLKQLGFCTRSTTRFLGGTYYHHYTPDAAPDAVATLSRADLAGAGARYTYAKDSVRSVFNKLTALFRPNYSGDGTREIGSGFLATTKAEDAASVAKYGTYPTTYSLPCVRDAAMAAHVIAHQLLEVGTPLLTVTFAVFWERANLQPGQTITITDDIFSGRDYWIEAIRHTNKFEAQITAREWWA